MCTSIQSTPYKVAASLSQTLPLRTWLFKCANVTVPAGPHFQINSTIRRQLLLTRLRILCELPMRVRWTCQYLGCVQQFDDFDWFHDFQVDANPDMWHPAFMQTLCMAMKAQRQCNWVIQRNALLLNSSFGFVGSDCFAAIHGGIVPVPVRPPTFYPDFNLQSQHASTC